LPANSGWTLLTSAEGVNDHGQIVGFGTIDGRTRAFLMTPYDVALQDAERGVTVLVNSSSGDYRVIDCSGNNNHRPRTDHVQHMLYQLARREGAGEFRSLSGNRCCFVPSAWNATANSSR
jgi:probable HAF family extracellular repeat protein